MFKNFLNFKFLRFAIPNLGVQILGFLSIFILAKYFNKTEFGSYNYFLSFVAPLSILFSGRLEFAFFEITLKDDLSSLIRTIFVFAVHLLILLVLLFLAYIFIVDDPFFVESSKYLVMFIPFSAFFLFVFSVLITLENRQGNLNTIVSLRFTQTILFVIVLISSVSFKNQLSTLFFAFNISYIIPSLFLMYKHKSVFQKISYIEFVNNIKKYKRFIFYVLPSNLLSEISAGIPILLIGSLYSSTKLAYFALALRIVQMPIAFITKPIEEYYR